MSKADILHELPKLKPEDRLEILDRIYELDRGGWVEGCELSDGEKSMLDARLAEYEKTPDAGSSWEEVEARILRKSGP